MVKLLEISDPDVLFRHAVSLHNVGNVQEAIPIYKQLLDQFPDNSTILTAFGAALLQSGDCFGSIQVLEKSLETSPNQPVAFFHIGSCFYQLRRLEEALESYDRAISLKPDFAEAYCNHGVVLKELEHFEEALISFDQAIAFKPDFAHAYKNRGILLNKLKRFHEALETTDKAISFDPNLAEAHCNRGAVLNELKRFDEALISFDRAIALNSDYALAYWNKSLSALVMGDYEQGWKLYKWRWEHFSKERKNFSEPLWLGDASISGKTLLLYAEQGLGDVIQFSRYVSMATDLGANVLLEVQPSLVSLLSTLKSDITIIESGEALPAFDFQCPIMSLPLAFKTTLESIPADIPYLFSDPEKQKMWKELLGVRTKKRIGLVCSGSTILTNDAQRSLSLRLFKLLLELPFDFHLLQKEIRPDDEVFLAENPHIQTHHKDLNDFSDTAALIMEMDLVISVDTSVAHLTGALGKPIWILLPWNAEWRWLLDRTDSPWYPTATLFRQREIGNWESVIADVCERLNSYDSDIDALLNEAAILGQSGNTQEAILSYKQLITQYPKNPKILTAFGMFLLDLKIIDEGVKVLEESLRIFSNQPIVHFYIGNVFYSLKRFNEALDKYECALILKDDYSGAYCNRGVILSEFKRFDEALESFDKALALRPNFAEAYCNRGSVLNNLKRFDEALFDYNQAIILKPDYAEAYYNRGVTLKKLKHFDEALESYDQAITLDSGNAWAYWGKSIIKLTSGDYVLGLQLYEWRWKSVGKEYVRNFSQPLWLGNTPILGKTILIYAEQGLGDVIQFCRYVHMVRNLGANVILEVFPSLVSLLSTLKSDITIIEKGVPLSSFDFQCPIMSLSLAFQTTLESIPSDIPYLFPDPVKQRKWEDRLGVKTKKRIGLVCSGSTTHKDDLERSISLHLFIPLLDLPFEFHLLQKEIRADDEAFLANHSSIKTHHKDLNDFSDTAALIMEMDLVISVDTSVAHLTGALGKPSWILLAWNADWRWFLDRTDSPWYPTATLFRQREIGNWESVIADVCERLMFDE